MHAAHDSLSLRQYGPSHGSHAHGNFQVLLGLEGTLELDAQGCGRLGGRGRHTGNTAVPQQPTVVAR